VALPKRFEDCQIRHAHGISIGSGTSRGIRDMLMQNCTFENTDNDIRIKSMRGAGGPIEHIRYSNIQTKDVKNAIMLDLLYTDNHKPDFGATRRRYRVLPTLRLQTLQSVALRMWADLPACLTVR
jgi:polygalacturonase